MKQIKRNVLYWTARICLIVGWIYFTGISSCTKRLVQNTKQHDIERKAACACSQEEATAAALDVLNYYQDVLVPQMDSMANDPCYDAADWIAMRGEVVDLRHDPRLSCYRKIDGKLNDQLSLTDSFFQAHRMREFIDHQGLNELHKAGVDENIILAYRMEAIKYQNAWNTAEQEYRAKDGYYNPNILRWLTHKCLPWLFKVWLLGLLLIPIAAMVRIWHEPEYKRIFDPRDGLREFFQNLFWWPFVYVIEGDREAQVRAYYDDPRKLLSEEDREFIRDSFKKGMSRLDFKKALEVYTEARGMRRRRSYLAALGFTILIMVIPRFGIAETVIGDMDTVVITQDIGWETDVGPPDFVIDWDDHESTGLCTPIPTCRFHERFLITLRWLKRFTIADGHTRVPWSPPRMSENISPAYFFTINSNNHEIYLCSTSFSFCCP